MRILFAGGGTAGHINPALSVANYIKEQDEDFDALFIGTQRGLEKKLVPMAGYEIKYIDIRGFDRKHLLKNISVLFKLAKANAECKKIIREFRPDAVVCTGGYVSGPVAMAAHKMGVPAIIHEQNVYPGLTVRGAEKYVKYTAVSFEETLKHMKNPQKCIVTGNPIRAEILRADKERAKECMNSGEKPFVLVFGGSLGAAKLNETMCGVLEKLAKTQKVAMMFGTGDRNYDGVVGALSDKGVTLPDDIKIVPYIDDMSTAMAAADVVVARAGAITVSEIAALAKPSVLVPSPNVVRNHQEQNAREFEKNGAAEVICEQELTSEVLYERIVSLAENKETLSQMSANAKKMAKVDALEKIYDLIKEIIKE